MREVNAERLYSYQIKKHFYYYLEHVFIIESLIDAINKYAKGKVLDIGCGNKPYLELFKGKIDSYIGCDIIQSSGNCVDVLCPAQEIPLESLSFDTVFSTQTIEHVGDFQGMVDEVFRLLKPGGHFIVSGPMYWPLHEEPYDYFRFTKHGFRLSLEKAGFEVLEINPNGGKWALLGQTLLLTLPKWMTFPKITRTLHNLFYEWLDRKFFDPINTMNYVVIAKKSV
jgi:SAM-dependent methyltransferase